MKQITANDAKSRFGELLDNAIREPVTIERHGRGVAVVMSKEAFEAAEAAERDWLRAELDKGVRDLEQGNYVELDRDGLRELFDEIKREGRESLQG